MTSLQRTNARWRKQQQIDLDNQKGDAIQTHTKGPWKYRYMTALGGETRIEIFCGPHANGTETHLGLLPGWKENAANARLIAAAPALYEACLKAQAVLRVHGLVRTGEEEAYNKILAALRLADGKE